ncbi:addiction module antitoxin [mine drainage metagenome]|uniref:Addiction module antitoxin n=2 Tax=mine drainage metagenome TaxID=410659 RepID=T1DEX7_9ZZZZ
MTLHWLARARVARFAAIDFIAQDNPRAALGQLDEIEKQTDLLSQNPGMGRASGPGRWHARLSSTRQQCP